jgi:hypothetical protein
MLCSVGTFAQDNPVEGDFRSKQSGSWSTPDSWETFVYDENLEEVVWKDTDKSPSTNARMIYILSGHNIEITQSSLTITDIFLTDGGILTINENSILILDKHLDSETFQSLELDPYSGSKVIVKGTLQAEHQATISVRADDSKNFIIESTGTYKHAFKSISGTIPLATWVDGSTLYITGYTTATTAPGNLDQNFYNVTWDTPLLTRTFNCIGNLINVRGNLDVINTGNNATGILALSTTTTTVNNSFTLTVGGDFFIRENAAVYLSNDQTSPNAINVEGDFHLLTSNTNDYIKKSYFTDAAILNIHVGGKFVVAGNGDIDLVKTIPGGGGTGNGNVALYIDGNTLFKGSIKKSGTGTATMNLNNVEVAATATNASATNVAFNVSGNWTNNGGVFNGTNSTFNFKGSNQSIQSNNQPFENVILAASGSKTLLDNATVKGFLTIEPGTVLNQNGKILSVTGDWKNNGGTYLHANGRVIMNGNGPLAQNIFSLEQPFYDLNLSNAGIKLLQQELIVEGDLSISSGATLDANKFDVDLSGDWMSDGAFTNGETTLYLTGTTPQLIGGSSPTTFFNLKVSNPSVQVISNQNLRGTLTLGSGVQFDPDGTPTTPANFALLSGDKLTANVGPLPIGAAITGEVVVQRYIHPEGPTFRYVATPVTDATISDISDDILVYIDEEESVETSTGSIFIYDEKVPGLVDKGWKPYSTALTNRLKVGTGYSVEMIVFPDEAKTLSIKGPVYQGTYTYTSEQLSFTNSDGSDGETNVEEGWNLIGNPYPSTINWQAIYNDNSTASNKIDPSIFIPDNGTIKDNLRYITYSAAAGEQLNGENLADGSGLIASGQSFWVKATGENPSLVIQEKHKSPEPSVEFYKKETPKDLIVLGIKQGNKVDETAVLFREDALATYEPGKDSYKLKNSIFNLSSLGQQQEDLSFNFMPWFSCSSEVPLLIENIKPGTYIFNVRRLESFTRPVTFVLKDLYTAKSIDITSTFNYEFKVTADPRSYGKDRFVLLATYELIQLDLPLTAAASCVGTAANVKVIGAQAGVTYEAYLDGVLVGNAVATEDSDLNISIASDKLKVGENQLVVKASRAGCEALSLTQTVTVNTEQVYSISEVQGGTSCGTGAVTLSAAGAPADAIYRWYTTPDAVEPVFESNSSSFTTPEISQSGWYYVSIKNAAGCEGERVKVPAEVTQIAQPVVSTEGGLLLATGAGDYQWYLNGEAIEGASNPSLLPVENGNYSVSLTAGSCTVHSEAFVYEVAGLDDSLSKLGINIWPVPSGDYLYIKKSDANTKNISIRIISVEGKQVLHEKYNFSPANVQKLDLSNLRSGLYILELQQENTTVRTRIIKQ